MSVEIKIEEVTKVIGRKMRVGQTGSWTDHFFSSTLGEEKREVYIEPRLINIRNRWMPTIDKHQVGWGCQIVFPATFRRILKGIRNKGFEYNDKAGVKIQSLTRVVKVDAVSYSVDKAELIEKMELLLKIHDFLYKK